MVKSKIKISKNSTQNLNRIINLKNPLVLFKRLQPVFHLPSLQERRSVVKLTCWCR